MRSLLEAAPDSLRSACLRLLPEHDLKQLAGRYLPRLPEPDYGVPGTAKSWVSEHLAAAISGDSTRLIQGTAGTDEASLRYGWNYATLLAKGRQRSTARIKRASKPSTRRQKISLKNLPPT